MKYELEFVQLTYLVIVLVLKFLVWASNHSVFYAKDLSKGGSSMTLHPSVLHTPLIGSQNPLSKGANISI